MVNDYLVSYGTYYGYLKQDPVNYKHFPLPIADVDIRTFNDSEISVKFNQSLRGKHLFVFGEVVKHLPELLMTLDAAVRCSAEEISVVLPYMGYSRQDKREGTRGCIGASAITNMIQSSGANRIISIDLHAAQIQGFCKLPFEHLSGINIFDGALDFNGFEDDYVFVSPDAGGMLRVQKFAKAMGINSLAMINKRRDKPGSIVSMELIGNVDGKIAILIDDIADTFKTAGKASDLLLEKGAVKTYALLTHPILSGDAIQNVYDSSFTNVLLSNTLNVYGKIASSDIPRNRRGTDFIKIIPCQDLLELAIHNIANNESISFLN